MDWKKLKNLTYIVFLCTLISIFGFGQGLTTNPFQSEFSTLSSDSVFLKIDQRIDQLEKTHAASSQIIELLELKAQLADSLNNPFMKYFAYRSLLTYPKAFSSTEYFKLLKETGLIQTNIGKTDEALATYFEAAHLADSLQNDRFLAEIYSSIGTVYKNQENAILALKYLKESLHYNEKLNDTIGLINVYMTTGNAYKLMREENITYLDTAFSFYAKSLNLSIEKGYKRGIAGNYNNIGNVYRHQGKFEESLEQFFLALEINQATDNRIWVAYNYHNIGSLYQDLNNHKSALTYFLKSIEIKEQLNDLQGINSTYDQISISYAAIGRFKEAYSYTVKARDLDNELNRAEKNRLSQELEARFQNDKNEAEISKLMAEQELQHLIIEEKQKDLDHQAQLRAREKYLIYALAFILLIFIIAIFVFWKNSRQRKRYAETLTRKNEEIEQASSVIENARANLEIKNIEITDSINYAKRIQAAILPSPKKLESQLNSAIILYLPKDIVTGDFYWTARVDRTILFAVADCTGHGVPGAMISVICYNALNMVIKEFGFTDPGLILDETSKLILKQFDQSEDEVRDGMDIALCSFNTETRKLSYAGANIPLWLIRNCEAHKYVATRQPIGSHDNRNPFETLTISTQKGDTIYLSSDGFTDQFGGEKGKKFLNIRFKELLIIASQHPVSQQSELLKQSFYDWKQEYDQVDDVCVLGVVIDS